MKYYRLPTWKYEIAEKEVFDLREYLDLSWGFEIRNRAGHVVSSLISGILTLYPGNRWDGASGLAIDSKAILPASAAHDSMYEAIRLGLLPPEAKGPADRAFKGIYLDENRNKWYRRKLTRPFAWLRGQWIYKAVDKFGEGSTKPIPKPRVLTAP